MKSPPRLARALLERMLPVGPTRDGLLGDLEELYRARGGTMRATLWYWREVIGAMARLSTGDRVRRRLVSPPGNRNWAGASWRLDLRYAVRALRKAPAFSAVAIVAISIGVGATSTIFSAINTVLLRPPHGVRHANELVRVHRIEEDGSGFHASSFPAFLRYRAASSGLSDLAAFSVLPVTLESPVQGGQLIAMFATHSLFDLAGSRIALGRFFHADEDTPESRPVAVLSHRTWRDRFAGDTSVVGATVRIGRHPVTIIGVAESGLEGHNSVAKVALWLSYGAAQPLGRPPQISPAPWVELLGRLPRQVSLDRVTEVLGATARGLHQEDPRHQTFGVDIRRYAPISREAVGPLAAFGALLLAGAGLVLFIACVNVGGMLLARSCERVREVALRLAVGATRVQVVRLIVMESVLLFLAGGVGGLLIAAYLTGWISRFQLPFDVPLSFNFRPDLRVLFFALAIAFASGLLFGLAPALRGTRLSLATSLKDAGKLSSTRLRSLFVVAQLAASTVLLVAAGLVGRGLTRASAVDPGFDVSRLHAVIADLSVHNYTDEEAEHFFDTFATEAEALPSVEAVTYIDLPPVAFGLGAAVAEFTIPGLEDTGTTSNPETDFARVEPDYFGVAGIPLAAGRAFTDRDRTGAPPVAIVNQTFAGRMWPGDDPLGRRVRLLREDTVEVEIVGVARNAKYRTLGEPPLNMLYVPLEQWPEKSRTLVVRTARTDPGLSGSLADIARRLAPELPLDANTAYENLMAVTLLPNRVAGFVSASLGGLGLVLTAIGLYGVLAYSVTQRHREIGIRIALGAGTGQVRGLVLRQGAALAAAGLAIGFGLALAVSHALASLLFGVSATDPLTFTAIAALLMAVSGAASFGPAWRATRTDPVRALRAD